MSSSSSCSPVSTGESTAGESTVRESGRKGEKQGDNKDAADQEDNDAGEREENDQEEDDEIQRWLCEAVSMRPSVAHEYAALFDEVGLDSLEFLTGEEEITGTFLEELGIRRFHIMPILLQIQALRRVLSKLPPNTDASSYEVEAKVDVETIFSKFSTNNYEKRQLAEVIWEQLGNEGTEEQEIAIGQ